VLSGGFVLRGRFYEVIRGGEIVFPSPDRPLLIIFYEYDLDPLPALFYPPSYEPVLTQQNTPDMADELLHQ